MKTSFVERQYDHAAQKYDYFSEFVLGKLLRAEKYRDRAIALLGDLDGATVLDVGCGTGRSFPHLAKAVGPTGRIIGLDCSSGMLRQAEQRARTHGWRNIELVKGDASDLKAVTHKVDALSSVWCYGMVDDLNQALNRAVDILLPGGRLSIMTFSRSRAEAGPLRSLYPLYRWMLSCCVDGTQEDIDDRLMRAKWKMGRTVLSSRLGTLTEERYVHGTLNILAGRRSADYGESIGEKYESVNNDRCRPAPQQSCG